jgi:hypothetical protein
MSYFTDYPNITINNPINNENIDVTDIFRRLIINTSDLVKDKEFYTTYYIKDNERPEQISFNYYGDTKFYWNILLFNNILTIKDWVLTTEQVEQILYTLPNQNAIKFYKSIEVKNNAGKIIIPADLIVPSNFSITVDGIIYQGSTARTPVTYREDFIEANEKKRKILLLNPSIVFNMGDKFSTLISYTTNILTNIGTKYEEI